MSAAHHFIQERLSSKARAHPHALTRRSAIMFLLACAGLGMLGAAPGAYAANPAESFVQANVDRSFAILNDSTSDAGERQRQFRALLLSIVDVRRVALFTLGPYARGAAPASMETFELAFANLLTEVYLRGLSNYTGVDVTGSTERGADEVIVNVAAARAGGPPQSIAFRVRRADDGRHVVTDLQIEGAWLAITQRAEFAAYLQRNGGDLGALSAEIEDRAARFRVTRIEREIQRPH